MLVVFLPVSHPMVTHVFARLYRRKRVCAVFLVGLLMMVVCLYHFLTIPKPPTHRRSHVKLRPRTVESPKVPEREELPPINYNAHIFYYAWYGNVRFNGRYIHWGHERMPHYHQAVARRFSTELHHPPEDIGANFYPQLGLYSFSDSTAFEEHFRQIRSTGIGVVVLSWYPPHMADDHGVPTHYMTGRILDFADKFNLKVAFHIEPYDKRNVVNLRRHLRYIVSQNFTRHRAYYRLKSLPVYYIYDSYRTEFTSWARLLTARGDLSVRNTDIDGYFIGLYFRNGDCHRFADTGFNGAFSYFGVDGFSPGSRMSDWTAIVRECRQRGVEFIPCVAPGYDDTAVRPWNAAQTRDREHGRYYRVMFEAAVGSGAYFVAITSFNEWHEGTQIEPAVPKTIESPLRTYKDYRPNPPDFYLHLTRVLVLSLPQPA